MIVTTLDAGQKKYLVVFRILSSEDAEEVASWIKRKITTGNITVTGNADRDSVVLQTACMKKFGESPQIIEEDTIPVIYVNGGPDDDMMPADIGSIVSESE